MLVDASDLVTSCASKTIRDAVKRNVLVQAGTAIPIFAMTMSGKNLIMEKIRLSTEPVLVKSRKLPVLADQQPDPLV
jgi:hypothetical protein